MRIAARMNCLILLAGSVLAGATAARADRHETPVFWFRGNGNFVDSISGVQGTPHGDVRFIPGINGQAVLFDGKTAGIGFPDLANLKLTQSISISTWVYVVAYPSTDNILGQIIFRGDDRNGQDPFTLDVTPDGHYQFHIEPNSGEGLTSSDLYAPCALHQWTLVTATLDDTTGFMRLYLNGESVAETDTSYRPYADLDPNSLPGIGVGDNQGFGKSGYHERLDGAICDLKVYDRSLAPLEVKREYTAQIKMVGLQAQNADLPSGGSTIVAVFLNAPAPAGGLTLQLSVAPSGTVTVPATVTVAAHETQAQFTVAAKAVDAPSTAIVTAMLGGVARTVTLHVHQ